MMANASVRHQMKTRDFHEQMAPFPCMFNMPCYNHPVRNRLKNRQAQLIDNINRGIDDKEEERKTKNALTWIFYQLGHYDRAIGMNESVLVKSEYTCVVALGNCVFMDWLRTGRVSEHYKLLDELSVKPDFKDQVLEGKAEQAFCLGKLGNMLYVISAAELYEYILARKEHDHWRYLLGVTYRRLAFMRGIEKPSGNKLNQMICHEQAMKCFEKVVRCSNACRLATSLVNISCYYTTSKQATITGVESAVTIDPNSSEVCLIGGIALLNIDINKAVTLLEKAVEIDPKRSVSHHQVGKAYVRQLIDIRRRNPDRVNEIQQKAESHFRSAYELSSKLNASPLFDLAGLLQNMGNCEMAKREALTLLTSRHTSHKLIQLIKGHALLFQLCKSAHHLYLSILASIAFLNSEPTNDADRNAVCWILFDKDQRYTTEGRDLNKNTKELIRKLNGNCHGMDRILQCISSLFRDGRIDDTHAVVGEALDMARQGLDEEALLFLELVSLRRRKDTSEFNRQRFKLLITEAKLCLKDSFSLFSLFFRQSFDLIFRNKETRGDELESDSDISIKIDILVLFNDSIENSSTLSADTAYGLEEATSSLFQLNVAFNPILEASLDGRQGASFVDFVKKHTVDVILVVFQGDGAETHYLLEKLGPFISESNGNDEDRRPLVLMIQCDDQPTPRLPADLKNLPCLSLGLPGDEFPNLFRLKETQDEADTTSDFKGFVQAYFEGNDDNVMTLFKYLTRHSDQ